MQMAPSPCTSTVRLAKGAQTNMQILNSRCDPEEFFFDLAIAPESVLILDYDGTLAPFRTEPQRAVAYPGIYTIIDSMMERGNTRVVIVSGRAVASLLPLLPFTRRPEIWGCHGWERLMPDGRDIIPHVDSETRAALESATQLVADVLPFAARCEIKPASVAVHWRGLPEQLANWARDAVGEEWRTLAQREGLRLRDFDGGIEFSARCCRRGMAHAGPARGP